MKYFQAPVANEYVPLVRRVLGASGEQDLRDVGEHGDINYLVEDDITQDSLAVWDALIAGELAGMRRLGAVNRMQILREAIQPYVGRRLLRMGLWFSGRSYQIYLDSVTETIVHFTSSESPRIPSPADHRPAS